MSLAYFDSKPWMRAPARFALVMTGILILTTVLLEVDNRYSEKPHRWLIYIPVFVIPLLNAIFVIPVARRTQQESKRRGA